MESGRLMDIHYFCNLSNLDGCVYVYVCIWLGLGLGLVLGFGLGLGFALICSGHGHLHLCLTGCGNSAPLMDATRRSNELSVSKYSARVQTSNFL